MNRRRWVTAGLGVAVLVAAALVYFASRDSDPASRAPVRLDQAAAATHARESCLGAADFVDAARANDSAEDVLSTLQRATRAARRATDADPHWVRLLSGLQTLEYSLHNDDAEAARTGLAIVRDLCDELGIRP